MTGTQDQAPEQPGHPFFSVVIPLYNKALHIDATLAAVAAQTHGNYEVIVVDDGSRDNGAELVERVGGRVRLLRQANAGPGAARNRGIAAANGDWVAFLDADDLWNPDHLATLARTIAACPAADMVATGFVRGTVFEDIPMDGRTPDDEAPHLIDFFAEHSLIWTSATAVRTAVLRAEPFNIAWPGEDIDLWIRLAVHHPIAVSPQRTALYVQRTGGIMDSQAAAETAIPIARQPVFATLAAILANPTLTHRHAAVAALRNRLLLDYTRPALFNGQTALARSYLRALRAGGRQAPLLYRLLAHLPATIVRTGSRTYGRVKVRRDQSAIE